MNRTILASLTSVALSFAAGSNILANPAAPTEPPHADQQAPQVEKLATEKLSPEVLKACEEKLAKIKEAGNSLPTEKKVEFDSSLKHAAIEIEDLNNPAHKDSKKHLHAFNGHIKFAEKILHQQEILQAKAKKEEERQAKAQERKVRAEERKAKAEARAAAREQARKAKKDAPKIEKKLLDDSKAPQDRRIRQDQADNGRSEGASTQEPGTEARKPLNS
ncbi:MAG: hypothetical protein FJX03_00990 [Alphaproteobacteria bacterium]|nr:hypothetical protein [Alphaproteobacteria bacterium]